MQNLLSVQGFLIAALALLSIIFVAFRKKATAVTLVCMYAAILISTAYLVAVHNLYFIWICLIMYASLACTFILFYKEQKTEIFAIASLATSGLMFAMQFDNLIVIYTAIELSSIATYILLSINSKQTTSHTKQTSEAAMKYFIIGAISACVSIYGISLIYGGSGGVLDLSTIATAPGEMNQSVLMAGYVMLIVGLLFKISAFPLHIWTPDIYQGSRTSAIAFVTNIPKIAVFILLFKITYSIPLAQTSISAIIHKVFWLSSICSMLVGSVGALFQNNIKRIIGYSGIAHIGYLLMLLSVPNSSTFTYVIYYFTIYAAINIGILFVVYILEGAIVKEEENLSLTHIGGLYKVSPSLALCLSVLIFSNAGIPPLAGFFIKYAVFSQVIANRGYVIAVFGLVTSIISCYYYLKIIKSIYFDEPKSGILVMQPKSLHGNCIMAVIIIATVLNVMFIYF